MKMVVSVSNLRFNVCILLLLFTVSSCKVQEIIKQEIKTEYVYDSVYIDKYHYIKEKGDTVFLRDSIFISKYKIIEKSDTVRDTIQDIKTVTKYKYRTDYKGWLCFSVLGIILLLWIIIKIIRKRGSL